MKIQPGVYRHHKGGFYTVLFTAWESTNSRERKEVVVYVSHARGVVNVRDLSEFVEAVDGKPRFVYFGDAKEAS